MRDVRSPLVLPNERKRLGQLLTDVGWITQEQLAQALRTQTLLGGRLGTCLLEIDAINENQLLRALAHQLRIRAARIKDLEGVPEEVYSRLDSGVAARCQAIPFRSLGSDLYVALLEVEDAKVVENLSDTIDGELRIFIGNEVRVHAGLESYYGIPLSERFRQLRERLDRQAIARNQHGPTEPTYEPSLDLSGLSGLSGLSDLSQLSVASEIVEPVREPAGPPDFWSKTDREAIAATLLSYLAPRFRRALLFRVQRDEIRIWMGTGSDVDRDQLESLVIGAGEPSVLLNLKREVAFYRGPLSPTPSHQRLADCWGGELLQDCIALPIRIRGRLVSAVLCDLGENSIKAEQVSELERVTRDAGNALSEYLRRKRQASIGT